jgi:DNA-directed RNA polymerase sigma subunit (sigma70/sigma32)/predicted transcriptional regulator
MKRKRSNTTQKPNTKRLKQEIRQVVNDKMNKSHEPEDIVRECGLRPVEVAVVDRFAFQNSGTIADVAKELGIPKSTARHALKKASDKIKGKKRAIRRVVCERILDKIEQEMNDGKTLEEIIAKVNLTKRQREVLDKYVLSNPPIGMDEAGKILGVQKATLTGLVKILEQKICGSVRKNTRIGKYQEMPDEKIRAEIQSLEAKTRSDAWIENRGLMLVAKNRGIIQHVFLSPHTIRMRKALVELPLDSIDFRDVIDNLGKDMQKMIKLIGLNDCPLSISQAGKTLGISTSKANSLANRTINEIIKAHEKDSHFELRKKLQDNPDYICITDEKERAVLQRRVFITGPKKATLAQIASDFGLSREAIRQVENRLIEKIMALTDEDYVPHWGGKRVRYIRDTIMLAKRKHDTTKLALDDIGIRTDDQRTVVRAYVLSRTRKTIAQTEEETGIVKERIRRMIPKITEKCQRWQSKND